MCRVDSALVAFPVRFYHVCINMRIQGNGGAATTVKEFIDCRDGKTYTGFPYSYWKHDSSDHKHPTIITQPAL